MEKKKSLKTFFKIMGIILVAIVIGLLTYLGDYYHADTVAHEALISDNLVTVEEQGNLTIFSPADKEIDQGFVFYPGGKVEAIAYAPLMRSLAQEGFTTVIVGMPFNLAVFNADGANEAMEALPEITTWFIGGHSLGGAMASDYVAGNPEKLAGLVLMGAYPNTTLAQTDITVLSLYGSEDGVLNREAFEQAKEKMPTDVSYQEITGGNHGNFGNYGEQEGDGIALISAPEQQAITVEKIKDIMGGKIDETGK
ncbi:alpha/beta hydrolase [Acetobacterium bakii]|uniref:Alpha/beta hydrolase fold-5 domain-containing protein n=1 Tax=Acetobacterium bakii TaxID=52689 RepID=A0A0L6U3W9_9FIRM|nr:alpha/beta hydrolase [Acetobacterium bakii]KNZ43027.1 hypothetical protein AKG39_02370 [Acetobacterium bakii]